jgi:hypothetical protein
LFGYNTTLELVEYYDPVAEAWEPVAPPINELNDIGDVDITTPADGDLLVYDDGDWVNQAVPQTVKNIYYEQMTVAQSFSAVAGAFTDLTGLSIAVTPQSTASKFLVESVAYLHNAGTDKLSNQVQVLVDSSVLQTSSQNFGLDAVTTNNPPGYVVSALHSPGSVTPITFKTQASQASTGSSISVFVNRREADSTVRSLSFLKVTEFE